MKPLSDRWLDQFAKASQIVRTGRDEKGNYYNAEFGRMNQACWIGEHAHLLLSEIKRLRKSLKVTQEIAADYRANWLKLAERCEPPQ